MNCLVSVIPMVSPHPFGWRWTPVSTSSMIATTVVPPTFAFKLISASPPARGVVLSPRTTLPYIAPASVPISTAIVTPFSRKFVSAASPFVLLVAIRHFSL